METTYNYQLLIDFDHKSRLRRWLFERRMDKMLHALDFCIDNKKYLIYARFRFSKITTHGYHYYIPIETTFKLTPLHLLFIQTILGDDKFRCVHNFRRLLFGWNWKNSNILFKENELNEKKI